MKLKVGLLLGIVILGLAGFFLYRMLHSEPTIQSATVNGIKLAYYTKGRGEPIILLEDFGMDMTYWDPSFVDKVSQTNEVIVFDYRGIGVSSGSKTSVTVQQVLDDIAGLQKSLKLSKTHVLGWAGGSTVAQLFTEKYPEKVNKLILVSSTPGDTKTITPPDTTLKKLQSTKQERWEDVYLSYMFYSDDAKQAYISRIHKDQQSMHVPVAVDDTSEIRNTYLEVFGASNVEQKRLAGLPVIKNKTLLITGDQDELVAPENTNRIKSLLLNATVSIVPGAGYGVLFEKPAETSLLISQFLNK